MLGILVTAILCFEDELWRADFGRSIVRRTDPWRLERTPDVQSVLPWQKCCQASCLARFWPRERGTRGYEPSGGLQ